MMGCITNPLFLFLAVWGTAGALYWAGVFAGTFPSPGSLTVGALLLNFATFCLGYLTSSLFRSLPPIQTGVWKANDHAGGRPFLGAVKPLTRRRLVRALQVTLLVGLAAFLMELYRLTLLASQFNTSWSSLVTRPALLRRYFMIFVATSLSLTSPTVTLLSLMNGVFSVGFVLLGLLLYVDQTRWKYFYMSAFLLLSLSIGLLRMSRYETTANILFLVFAYCSIHALRGSGPGGPRARASRFTLLLPLAALALLFLLIDLLLHKSAEYAQANRLQGFAYQVYWYLASPQAAFNEFLAAFQGDYTLGQNTFFPFYKWLCRFHLTRQTEIAVYAEKVYIPFAANTYTYLRNFYEDFGLLGVALAPYGLGWIAAAVRRRAYRCFQYLNLYIVLLMFILFSFFNFYLISNQIYLQILFGFVFLRYDLKNVDHAAL